MVKLILINFKNTDKIIFKVIYFRKGSIFMQYRFVEKWGFEISTFGMGCMRLPIITLPDGSSKINRDEAVKMIRHAIDSGVNYIDTAYPYHSGESELVVGEALKDGYREKTNLATKLPVWLVKTHEDFERYLNEQLEKLGTDHIDFYLLHALGRERWDKIKSLNVFDFIEKAKASGKIRHIGFSFHDELPVFKEIADSYDWDMCQIQFNYLDSESQAGLEGLKYAGSKGIPVVIMEPLKGGKLSQSSPDVQAIWDKAAVRRSHIDWAFQYVTNFPETAVVLSGVSTMGQLDDNLRIFDSVKVKPNSLSDEELKIIGEVKALYASRIKVGCTGCNYCMPCPSGVSIPEVFALYNNIAMYGMSGEYKKHYERLMDKLNDASRCRECGKCQKACPQGLPIIEKLKEAHVFVTSK